MLSHSNINNVYVNKTHHVIPFKKRYKARRKFITCSVINFLLTVGMTRLELATTRPPDAYATNCATSRDVECGYKSINNLGIMQITKQFFIYLIIKSKSDERNTYDVHLMKNSTYINAGTRYLDKQ